MDEQLVQETPKIDTLPCELLTEILSYLDIDSRNRIRNVQYDWNNKIKCFFGVKIILNNHNVDEMSSADCISEIQVRNLTRRLQNPPIFDQSYQVRELEIMGMILSSNLLVLLSEFENLEVLKLSRVYLETDRRLLVTSSMREKFPARLKRICMRFLKIFHRDLLQINHRSNDLFKLTSSDNNVLHLLTEFNLSQLEQIQIYHDLSSEAELYRNSDMIHRAQAPDIELENDSTQTLGALLIKSVGSSLKRIQLDNLPVPAMTRTLVQGLEAMQLDHFQVKGLLGAGWSTILESQVNLKTLDVVLMDKNILRSIMSVIGKNSRLETISIVAATPNNVSPSTPNEPDVLDLSFLKACGWLKHLKIHFAPKIMDLGAISSPIVSLDACGNVQGIVSFIASCYTLKNVAIELIPGPLSADTPWEGSIYFTTAVLHSLIDSKVSKITVTENGAKEEFQNFVDESIGNDFVNAHLDQVQYCNFNAVNNAMADVGPRMPVVNVPSLSIEINRTI